MRASKIGQFVVTWLLAWPRDFSHANTVRVIDGRLVVTDRVDRLIGEYETDGCVHAPSASSDGRRVVFTQSKVCDAGPYSVVILDLRTRRQSIVISTPFRLGDATAKKLMNPVISIDNKFLYFLFDFGAGTTYGLAEIDLNTRRVTQLGNALGLRLVPSGKYAGKLIIFKRTPLLTPKIVYWYWLYDPVGKKDVGIVGLDENDADLFLEAQR